MQHWTKMCHSKDEKLDKKLAILDKKKFVALSKILVLNIMCGEKTTENFHIKICLRQSDSEENH